MAKFKYRMQNILNIKLQLENQAKMAFALAQAALNEEEEKKERLLSRKAAYEEAAAAALMGSISPRNMRENKEAILMMDGFIEAQQKEIEKAAKKAEEARKKLQDAIMERKIQEKLRENAFAAFMKEEAARESKEIDELTSYIYGQVKN